jgi:hypothetical protein
MIRSALGVLVAGLVLVVILANPVAVQALFHAVPVQAHDVPAAPAKDDPPACDNYDVGLALRRIFAHNSPADYGTIQFMWNVREVHPMADGVRTCSAELNLNRSWLKSNHVYVEWTVKPTGASTAYVHLAHMEDL